MKNALVKTLGIFEMVAGLVAIIYFCYWLSVDISDAFSWGLTFLIPGLLIFACGLFTVKRNNFVLAYMGLLLCVGEGIYIYILVLISGWMM